MFEKIERLLNTEAGGYFLILLGLFLMGLCGGIEQGTIPFPF